MDSNPGFPIDEGTEGQMKRTTLITLKTVAWVGCLIPLAKLVWGAAMGDLGADPAHTLAFATGLAAIYILAISLAITPVRKIIPKLGWLVRFRRLLGLFAFFYASLHMVVWVVLYSGLDFQAMAGDLTKRKFIIVGMATWLLLLPLALTSTQWAIKKMGGKNWNRLHKLVYLAAYFAMMHFWWQVKAGVLTPVPITIVLWTLLLVRLGFWIAAKISRIRKRRLSAA